MASAQPPKHSRVGTVLAGASLLGHISRLRAALEAMGTFTIALGWIWILEAHVFGWLQPPQTVREYLAQVLAVRTALAIVILTTLAILVKLRRISWSEVGFSRTDFTDAAFWAVLGGAAAWLAWHTARVICKSLCDQSTFAQWFAPQEAFGQVRSLVVLVFIVGALCEETVFRGVMLPRLRRALGSWPAAVAFDGFAFAAFHFDGTFLANKVFIPSILTIVTAISLIRTSSLLPAIGAHFVFNLLQELTLQPLQYPAGGPNNAGGGWHG